MADLIDRQAASKAIEKLIKARLYWLTDTRSERQGLNAAMCAIEDLPSVEVVRCKDCKWFNDIGCSIRIIDDSDKPTENDYCSFGERKDG